MSIYHQPIICMHILECVVIFIAIFRMFIIICLIKQHVIKTQITCILHARRNSPDIRWFVKLLIRLYICVCGKYKFYITAFINYNHSSSRTRPAFISGFAVSCCAIFNFLRSVLWTILYLCRLRCLSLLDLRLMITPDHIKISVHSLAFGQSIKLNDALKISKYFF